ncbi:acetate--CoA ligase family protein [Acidothermaceae bacterium B102]|nr:acetate--CoA ligase family protein [Acidothermaceae bacterium B102]
MSEGVAAEAMESLVRPRSLAIVGASDDPSSIGGAPLVNLSAFGAVLPVHLVSRSRTEINGSPCLSSIDLLPADVDCAVLVVPAHAAAASLEACGRRGVRAAIVYASGFAETGAAGAAAQQELVDVAARYGMAVAGPNCLGLINFVDGLPLTFGSIAPQAVPASGGLGLVAQSGAMTMALTYAAQAEGVPVSYAISTGNEAVVTLEDYVGFLLEDDHTRCVAVLAEQIRRPREFRRLARRALAYEKPLVLLQAGREGAAAAAAASHTGALAGDYLVIETVLRDCGVVLVDTLDELVDAAGLLTRCARPSAAGIGLVTDSGSVKTLTLDLAAATGFALPELHAATTAHLVEVLPEFATVGNPVDITAQGLNKPSLYGDAAQALLDDDAIGMLLIAAMPGSDRQTGEQVDALLPVLSNVTKPVVYVFMGGAHPIPGGHDARVRAAGIPVLRSPERALRFLGKVAASAGARAATEPESVLPGVATTLTEHASKLLLSAHGLPVPRSALVSDVQGASSAAARLGYPVVLKAQAASMLHKTEAGAVAVGLADDAELRTAFSVMSRRVGGAADLDGYLVETMAGPGLELIVGARRDPDWGVVLLVGMGGVLAELLSDVVLLPADADESRIRDGLAQLRGHRLLEGFRGAGPVDVDAVVTTVVAVGHLMRDEPGVVEVDLNPLRVFAVGASVLDATVMRS